MFHDFIEVQTPEEIQAISVGSFHSLFLSKSGSLYGCGSNQEGQLGSRAGTRVEMGQIEIPEGIKVHQVVSGSLNAMMLAVE